MSMLFRQPLGSSALILVVLAVGVDAFCTRVRSSTTHRMGKSYNCREITAKIGRGDCLAPVTLGRGGTEGTLTMSRSHLQDVFKSCCYSYRSPCSEYLESAVQDYCLRNGTCYPVYRSSYRGSNLPCYEYKRSSSSCVGCWQYEVHGCRSAKQCLPFGSWNYATQSCELLSCSRSKLEDCRTRELCSSRAQGTWRCKNEQCSCRRCDDEDPEACSSEGDCKISVQRNWICDAEGDCSCRKCCVEGCRNGHWSFCLKEMCAPTQRAPDVKFLYKSRMVKDKFLNREVWRNIGTCSRCLVTAWGARYTQGCVTKRECHNYKEFRWQCREEEGQDCCATCERKSVRNCRSSALCRDHGGHWCEMRGECDPFGQAKPCKERPPLQCKHAGNRIVQQIERQGYRPRRCTDTDRISRAREMLMGSTTEEDESQAP